MAEAKKAKGTSSEAKVSTKGQNKAVSDKAKASKGSNKKDSKKDVKKQPKKPAGKPNVFRRFFNYLRNVRLELKRTTWPTRSELVNLSIIVIVALVFFGVLITAIDQIMVVVVNFLSQFNFAPEPTATPEVVDGASMITQLFLTGGR